MAVLLLVFYSCISSSLPWPALKIRNTFLLPHFLFRCTFKVVANFSSQHTSRARLGAFEPLFLWLLRYFLHCEINAGQD